ncbi:MAG: beta-propeller domain-containing protein [bacterium]|nr:beta-propeller domain-containing protein [bacterium]MDE0437169.1 beta-propeller domain-containing protein [bacterium]
MRYRLVAGLIALSVLLGSCTTETHEEAPDASTTTGASSVTTAPTTFATVPDGPVGLFASALVEFDSCDAFLDHVRGQAIDRVGPYGFHKRNPDAVIYEEAVEEEAADSSSDPAASPQAGVDYSTTNVQEAGVDEPDIVKTDGSRILAVGYRGLHYIDVSTGSPELVSSLPLLSWEGMDLWNQKLLMRDDTAVLMAHGFDPYGGEEGGITLVSQVDLSDPENMRVVGTLMVAADFVAARLVGERVALVLSSGPAIGSEFVYPSSTYKSAELRAERVNRSIIAESGAEHWAPRYELTVDGNTTEGSLIDCSSGYAPQEFSGFDTLSVLTFDIGGDIDVETVTTIMSGGDTVYGSTERLYVASHRWIDWDDAGQGDVESVTTQIHRFDISGPGGPVYEASGSVDGFLLNQFAMSEHAGYLRVASTDLPNWWWWDGSSESRVDVLERDGRELRVVGSVGGLGEGEQIFAVRFMGEVGYVVTFRQTDPLYTIDLSDPTAPEVLGELKILGYSAYLHPIGDGLLLGVGQDADQQGRIRGTQVSLFDVSDLENPVRTHTYTLPESSRSEAEFDHHAFLHWPPTGMVILPIWWWGHRDGEHDWVIHSEAIVLGVGPDGIEELDAIRQELDADFDYEDLVGYDLYANMDSVPISRSLVVDDTLFTLSWLGLKGSDLETLADTSWIQFPSVSGQWPADSGQ